MANLPPVCAIGLCKQNDRCLQVRSEGCVAIFLRSTGREAMSGFVGLTAIAVNHDGIHHNTVHQLGRNCIH